MLSAYQTLQCGGVDGHCRNALAAQLLMTSCYVHYGRAAGSKEPRCSAVFGTMATAPSEPAVLFFGGDAHCSFGELLHAALCKGCCRELLQGLAWLLFMPVGVVVRVEQARWYRPEGEEPADGVEQRQGRSL